MIMAGIAAMDHFTRIKTIRQNGTSMSRMVTRLEPFVMELSFFACSQPRCVRL